MISKDIIETNKIYVGDDGDFDSLFVGASPNESRFAVLTDENSDESVVYDKVRYDFGVNNITTIVPANGGTYNITASVTTKTHGDGTVEDNIAFSPTSFTVPANTGDSYNSAVSVTQAVSNLVQNCEYTVEADSVTSLTLTLNTPSTIPASGGSVNNTTYTLKAYYKSGKEVDDVTTATLV